jgi:uncharacterized protein (TIGR03435 family)
MARRGLRGWRVGGAVLLMGVPLVPAQAAAGGDSPALAAYDVVSVKPARPERVYFMGVQEMPDGIHGETVTVAVLVQMAFSAAGNLSTDEAVVGLPDWAKGDYFAIEAKMGDAQMVEFAKLTREEKEQRRKAMLQALLADRFKLKLHPETRQVLVYELVVAKGGPKMKEGEPEGGGLKLSDGRLMPMRLSISNGAEEMIAQLYSMQQLADFLTRVQGVGHKVTDKTGMTGKYSFKLSFAASRGVGPASAGGSTDAATPDDAPSIFTALEEQLGLKLQRGVGTVDTVVVDHVERPAAD